MCSKKQFQVKSLGREHFRRITDLRVTHFLACEELVEKDGGECARAILVDTEITKTLPRNELEEDFKPKANYKEINGRVQKLVETAAKRNRWEGQAC